MDLTDLTAFNRNTLRSRIAGFASKLGSAWPRLQGRRRRRATLVSLAGLVGASLWLPLSAAPAAEPTVTLHYVRRPPYMMPQGDQLAGLTGEPSHQAFLQAKVPVQLVETPFARQLRVVEQNAGLDCMVGMFWKAEREAWARYSKPVYQDQPQLVLAAAQNRGRLEAHGSIQALFKDRSLRLLVKLGYSYGTPLDTLIDSLQPNRRSTPDESLQMLRQIHLGMADYMLIAPEEAASAIRAAGFQAADFAKVRYANMPDGERRHLLCSKNVPESVMQRLNAAIAKITAKQPIH